MVMVQTAARNATLAQSPDPLSVVSIMATGTGPIAALISRYRARSCGFIYPGGRISGKSFSMADKAQMHLPEFGSSQPGKGREAPALGSDPKSCSL